nr:aromatic amino acid lyase [Gemmatimonadaceae bacterium]
DGNREDVVPMSMGAAWKARRIVGNVRNVLAIELMCAAQGLDFRAPLMPGKKVQAAHGVVRGIVPHLAADRVLSHDIATIASAIERGVFASDRSHD